uniref:IgGFc-binding protein N-terminal domain-containing protein n=1 Tax=Setaria digitata TaxID=48799 RepID=A0A915Q5G2_9BILA
MDTYGREFVFVYPPNNSGSSGVKATLNIINPDTKRHAIITVEYPEFHSIDDKITAIRRTTTLHVKVLSTVLFEFNRSVILDSISNGLHSYEDARIVVHSSVLVSLLAHNEDATGARDSFLVLPISMAGNHYAFALPASALSGSTFIYLMPTIPTPVQRITLSLIREASSCACSHIVQRGKMLVFRSSGENITLRADSDDTFVIVAAVLELPTVKGSNVSDFGCFMPSAVPVTDCSKLLVQEEHVAPLLTGKYYLLTMPSAECESAEISIQGVNKIINWKRLIPSLADISNLIAFNEYGNMAAISTIIMLNVIRYGGYSVGMLNYEEGAYLHEVPAISQFISGMIPVIVPSDSNQITVIADHKAMSSAYFDGEISLSFAPLPFLNGSFYYASGTVPSGFHFFYADGLYLVFVSGRINNSAYGFIPAFNSKPS